MPEEASQTTLTNAGAPPASSAASFDAAHEAGADLGRFLRSLLDIQCELVGAVAGAAYIFDPRARQPTLMAQHLRPGASRAVAAAPDAIAAPVLARLERMSVELLARATDGTARGGLTEEANLDEGQALYGARSTHVLAATPLLTDGKMHGASVLIVPRRLVTDETELLTRLALTIARFDAFIWRVQCLSEAKQRTSLRETLELLDAAQQGQSAGAMGALICHELARRFACTRVSMGLAGRDHLKLLAVSNADQVDRRGEAAVLLEAAMEECADQDVEVLFPAPPELENDPGQRRVTHAHSELCRRLGPSAILSLPLRVEGDQIGVLLLEREATDPFPPAAAGLLRLVAEFVGPAVWTRRLADRGVFEVVRDRTLDLGRGLVGHRYTAAKLIAAFIVLVLLLTVIVPIPDRIRAEAEVRPVVARTIVPPFTGYIEAVIAKPGDHVQAGQVLATMQTFELDAQLAEAEKKRETFRVQRDDEQSKGELGKVGSLEAQLGEVDASIRFITDRLNNATIKSPIDGIIGRGELEQLVGARVDPTQAMFEIVTEKRLAVVLIRERDIQSIAADQTGRMAVRAKPSEDVLIRVKRITPVSEIVRGDNVFSVECEIIGDVPDWRPGMTGTARLDNGLTNLMSRILRPIVDEIRLKLWI